MKFIIAILLYAVSTVALALPSPKDVDNAYNSGNYARAESMLLAVLKEKPSAKAHFRLAEVYMRQNKHAQSLSELQIARALDPSLKFVRDPNDFNKMLVREQTIANPPPVVQRQIVQQPVRQVVVQQPVRQVQAPAPVVIQQGPPQSAEQQIAVMKAKADLQKQDIEARKAENHSTLMIWLFILAFVLIAIFAVWYFNSEAEKKAERKRIEDEAAEQERLAKEQLSTFLDLTSQLADAELICKTNFSTSTEKQEVLDEIDKKQASIAQLMYDAKQGRTISSTSLYSIKAAVKNLIDAANDGKFPTKKASVQKPVAPPEPSPVSPGTSYSTPVSSGTTYSTPVRQSGGGGSSQTVHEHHHHHSNSYNNGNDLLTGVLIGEALASSNHSHETYREPYRTPPPVYETPVYETPVYETTIDEPDDWTSKASSSDSWNDDTETSASPSNSWDDDSSSSSSSSSSDTWSDSDSSSSTDSSDTNSW